ncbi:MAG: XRE family transcriptional regulator [Chlamydiae bacterium CG10_big_fil_rev_8_21_14_0_10_35_9]|nr:MAG: XRE family transcriptional regulator [Chlamydiae bacterium CG10_big_fil_rev_8_21_14_0_10_35_9]
MIIDSEAFKELRVKNNLTQKELAKKMGCVQSNVANIECGTQGLSMEVFVSLCKIYKEKPEQILKKLKITIH